MQTSFTVNGDVSLKLIADSDLEQVLLCEMVKSANKGVVFKITRDNDVFKISPVRNSDAQTTRLEE